MSGSALLQRARAHLPGVVPVRGADARLRPPGRLRRCGRRRRQGEVLRVGSRDLPALCEPAGPRGLRLALPHSLALCGPRADRRRNFGRGHVPSLGRRVRRRAFAHRADRHRGAKGQREAGRRAAEGRPGARPGLPAAGDDAGRELLRHAGAPPNGVLVPLGRLLQALRFRCGWGRSCKDSSTSSRARLPRMP